LYHGSALSEPADATIAAAAEVTAAAAAEDDDDDDGTNKSTTGPEGPDIDDGKMAGIEALSVKEAADDDDDDDDDDGDGDADDEVARLRRSRASTM
jgi:hypothetical protein